MERTNPRASGLGKWTVNIELKYPYRRKLVRVHYYGGKSTNQMGYIVRVMGRAPTSSHTGSPFFYPKIQTFKDE